MGRIPDEIIQQVRDRIDIVDLVGRFVSLRKAGRNYKGLCPFHGEKTPSFNVSSDRQSFYCFGCHEGGNAITFLMKVENLTFPEAVRSLAREHGIEIPETGGGDHGVMAALQAANDLAQSCYRALLGKAGNPAAAYLARRGLDEETIERFGIGFAPDAWDTVATALSAKGVSGDVGEKAGLLSARSSGGHYDRLRGRVVFPIQDARGRLIGFAGRALADGQEPKYLNTPESPLFRKREAFYGFPFALEPMRRTGRAVVVEGYFDRIALHRAGVEESVATCGTSLTADHAKNLQRRTREVVLLFDGDEAGQRAIERSLEVLLPEGLRARAAVLPAGDDPDTFLLREGAEALRSLVDGAVPALEFAIRRATAKGCATAWEKADAVEALTRLLALVKSPVERGEWCQRVALAVGTDRRAVEGAVRALLRGQDPREAIPMQPRRLTQDDRKLQRFAQCLIDHPALAARVSLSAFAELAPPGIGTCVVTALLHAAEEGIAIEDLCDQLVAEEQGLLRAVMACEEERLSEDVAARTISDTLGWLERRKKREERTASTRRLLEPGADPAALLAEKQKEIEARRPQLKSPSPDVPNSDVPNSDVPITPPLGA